MIYPDSFYHEYGIPSPAELVEYNLELAIPDILHDEIRAMEESWALLNAGKDDLQWDIHWDMLQSSVNGLEADGDISSELVAVMESVW